MYLDQHFPDHIVLSCEVSNLISSTSISSWRGAELSKKSPLVSQTMYKTFFLESLQNLSLVLGKH